MKEIIVVADNETGSLAAVSEALGAVGVNIEAVSAYGLDGKAIFRIITNDVKTAIKALSRLPNVEIREADTIVYKMINRPGELAKITRKLANRGVNLESLYIVSRKQDVTEVAIRPAESDMEKAREVLGIK
ncbi:ACT domain-containing protein [Candidatus Micrarchaeota archaeon]|nr:ACT domain-containing protein [Candidatus Micrarchaeota archaeon]